ncbi:MAG: MFS transporter [Actinomycetia bacterium]|nr:MFS transporter [Actinomycetes bacterium]MCP4083522.1 MFS transporter [Actinomycetes bacterium]
MTVTDSPRQPEGSSESAARGKRFQWKMVLGDEGARFLLPTHMLHSTGETLFGLSLVGSLFFNVSLDAARPRILLYLAVTMAPFAVLAPLIGPIVDRVRGGHRAVLLLAHGGRAALALVLATQLKGLLLYPLAFLVLVLAKVYSVSRNALVPVLVKERDHLVLVNSRLARAGTTAGAITAPIGLLILEYGGAESVLRAGAIAYAVGAMWVMRIPAPQPDPDASALVEETELSGPGIRFATEGMAGVRAAIGFVVFHIGFVLKSTGVSAWAFGGLAVANGLGSFVGTFVAPWLRRVVAVQRMLTLSIAVPGVFALIAALRFHLITAVLLAFTLGLGGSVARRAFDEVVQTEAPHARRGRAYARLETGLELAWVTGAIAAVVARAVDWVGLVALGLGMLALAAHRVWRVWLAVRIEGEIVPATLPLRLLVTAEGVAAQGDPHQAALLAATAVDAAVLAGAPRDSTVASIRELALEVAGHPDAESAIEVVRRAHEYVTEHTPA